MNVGKLTTLLLRLADALAAHEESHAAEGCRIAADIVARYGKMEAENRELLRENEELLEENGALSSALHGGCRE